MSNLPANNPATPALPSSTDWLRSLTRAMGTVNGRQTLMGGFSITPGQHDQIQRASDRMARQLASDVQEIPQIAREVAKLATLPAQDQSVTGAMIADAYVAAVRNFPLWAISEACDRIFAGRTAFGRPFGPTPVELGDLVREVIGPYAVELADLRALAAIEPESEPDPLERERILKGFEDIKTELRANKPKPWYDRDPETALRKRLRDLGQPESALDNVPERLT